MTMHIEFLVEEPSVEAALENLVPKIVPPDVTFAIHAYQGKPDLLGRLPDRLRGYRHWLPENWTIVVLVDADEQDCHLLKGRLEQQVRDAGLLTKSAVLAGMPFHVLNRLAVEELEAWFFGDIEAIRAVYPRVSAHLGRRARYRDPDAIRGGTWEALERELERGGYFSGGLPKIAVARTISAHMDPDRNRSRSFQVFREGLLAVCSQENP